MVFFSLISFSITFIFSIFCSLLLEFLLTITLFLHSIFLNQSCSLHYFLIFNSCCHWLLVLISYHLFLLQNFNISSHFLQIYEFHISYKRPWTWVLCAYCKLVVNYSHSCCSCCKLPNELNLL
jgi:hypothetical protein